MQWEKASAFLAACASILVFFLFPVYPAVAAETPKDEYRRVQKELRSQQKKLESVKKAERSVIDDIRKTTEELDEIEKQLAAQKRKIHSLQNAIAALEVDINRHQANLEILRARLKKRLRVLQRLSRERDALLVLIAEEDPAQAPRLLRYVQEISSYDYSLINRYTESLKSLARKQGDLKRLLASLKSEETNLARLDSSLEDKKKERETLLKGIRKEKGEYEKMIAELRDASQRLLKLLRESEIRERELKRKKDSRPAPAKEEPQGDSDFARLKGTLSWPVNGSVAVQYGTQVDPVLNLPVFRSGIHIKAPTGSPVRAVHTGKIVFADSFKGYGQLVIITHGGGYHTLYGNLGRIFSRNGAIIKEKQTIGEVGESSTLGTNGLYFEVRYKGKPLDPQQWLRK